MQSDLLLEFQGPYSWFAAGPVGSILDPPQGKAHGIYLWTVPTESGELVYYVGETGRQFSIRFREHLVAQLSGMYHVHDPAAFQLGKKSMLWPGLYDRCHRVDLCDFVQRLPELAEPLQKFVNVFHFFIAEIDVDSRLRKRIEGAIADHLVRQPGIVGSFQEAGIKYVRRRKDEPSVQIGVRSSKEICGLPACLEA